MFVKLQTNFPYKSSVPAQWPKEKDTMTQETKGCAT
jgi:hypothetical protein